MNLRYGIIVMAFVVTLLALFLGWFAYLNFGIERPLEREIASLEGIKEVKVDINNNQVWVSFGLLPEASLQQVHEAILKIAQKKVGNRKLEVDVQDHPSESLIQAWQQAQLAIEEGIRRHHYRLLSDVVNHLKDSLHLTRAEVGLNEAYIYFQLQKDEYQLLKILPRVDVRGEEE